MMDFHGTDQIRAGSIRDTGVTRNFVLDPAQGVRARAAG
jgi:hypothetical protein